MTKEDIIVKLMNSQYKPKGDIEGYPLEIVAEMIYYQVEQGNPFGVAVFENSRIAPKDDLGFDWDKTPDGKDFWQKVLGGDRLNKKIRYFYRNLMVTKDSTGRTMSIYDYMLNNIKGIEFDGDIAGFPHRVVAMMMTEQFNQGNPPNLEIFEKNVRTPRGGGGFTWDLTPEGDDFWRAVIVDKNWEVFDKKYPQTKNSKSNTEMRQEEILLDLAKQGYEPEGEIKDFPLEIVSHMLYEQVKQGNKLDVDVFERGKNKSLITGGFSHKESDQGEAFWNAVLDEDNLETAFRKYYEFNERNIELYCYALDLLIAQNPSLEFKGGISDFPVEVVAMMIAESINQAGYSNYENFERNPDVGFTWRLSPEGKAFWSNLINYKDFKPFFTEYPDLENECKQIRNSNAVKSAEIKKDISVKDFMKDNKSNLQALERRSKEVFDLTVELLTQLQILEDRQKQAKVEPKAKPKAKSKAKPKAKKQEPKKKTTTPTPKKEKSKPKEIVIEELDFDDDDLDFGKGGTTIDLQDLDF